MKNFIIKTFDYPGEGVEFLNIFKDQPHLFFLDSSQFNKQRGRYSFLGFSPFETFAYKGKDALELLKKRAQKFLFEDDDCPLPFKGGMVGFLGYDYGLKQEKVIPKIKDDLTLPDCFFGFYDVTLIIDHFSKKLYIVSTGLPETNSRSRALKAQERINNVVKLIYSKINGAGTKPSLPLPILNANSIKEKITSNFSKSDYLKAVKKCLDYIGAGDVYQVNLSQRYCVDLYSRKYDPIGLYLNLRNMSPSCFGAYLDCGDFNILSSSPERFLEMSGGKVQTRPMKGTRPRGKTSIQDKKLKEEILKSSKDKAELLMITDLLRNDLGRVCDYGSVGVKELRTLEEYETVYQTTSTVEGRLRKDKDVFDLLKECSPGGSITGCPKIRSMEIIEELERSRRGIYTGSLGYISFSGQMDFNILIRTVLAFPKKIYFHVGGGIVSDSIPKNEYTETLVKAKAIFDALNKVFLNNDIKNRNSVKLSLIFLDGKIVNANKNLLEELTPGNFKGKGVFETMRAVKGNIVAFDLHWKRFEKGLKIYGIKKYSTKNIIENVIHALIKKNGFEDARVRLCVWEENKKVRTAVVCQEVKIDNEEYKNGISAVISSKRRNRSGYSHIKSIDYKIFADAFKEAQNKNADEALLLNDKGQLVETSRSNIFIVQGGGLYTPSVNSGCLEGVTRKIVLKMANRINVKCVEGHLYLQDLFNAQEAFLTNSIIGIKPLVKVEGRKIGKGVPGPLTQELNIRYNSNLCI